MKVNLSGVQTEKDRQCSELIQHLVKGFFSSETWKITTAGDRVEISSNARKQPEFADVGAEHGHF